MTPTADKLIDILTVAGAPLNLDQLMDMLPYADRKSVGSLCRELVQGGNLRTTVEDNKVAYDVVGGVANIKDRASSRHKPTNLDRVRQLLADARRPLSTGDVVSGLPDMEPAAIRKALSNGSYRRLWSSTRDDDGNLGWVLPKAGAGSTVAVAVATATSGQAPAGAAPEAPPPPPSAPSPVPVKVAATPPTVKKPTTELKRMLDESVNNAEAAREAYVLSVVDPGIYSWLQESVRAARAARDAFARGAQ